MDLLPIFARHADAHRPVTRVFRHVLLIARFFNDVIEEAAAAHGLQSGEFLVIMTLDRNDAGEGMRPTELFRALLVSSGAITKRLDRLEALGLVTRVANSADKRSSPVRLTPKGAGIARAVRGSRTAMNDVADRLGREPLEDLDDLLVRYLDTVHAVTAAEDPAQPPRRKGARRSGQPK